MRVDNRFRYLLARKGIKTHFHQRLFGEAHTATQNGAFDSYRNIGHGCDCKLQMDEITKQSSSAPLAFRAKMRGAAAEHDPRNRRAANGARLAGAIVNLVNFLEIARLAVGVAIIP